MRIVFIGLTLLVVAFASHAQPVDQVIVTLERQYNAKVISVQERRGGLRVRLLQQDGVVKTINYRPEGWRPPHRPRIGDSPDGNASEQTHRERRER
jgi:hypothetical protein